MQRLDGGQRSERVMVASGEEPAHRPVVGRPGIFVVEGVGEEFQKMPGGLLGGVGDERRHNAVWGGGATAFDREKRVTWCMRLK